MAAKERTGADVEISSLSSRLARQTLRNISGSVGLFTPQLDMRERIQRLDHLPPMPDMARRILELAADPEATVEQLAELVEVDPSLAAQVIRWAKSPLYAYRGNISSVREAIIRVLGFDQVMNLALGLAALRPLSVPRAGPIGLSAFWQHAVYSAVLVQRLASSLPVESRPDVGICYLAGLLHNIGFLLLGHLYPAEFGYLNRLIKANTELSIIRVEQFALGIDHSKLGLWLAQAWRLPEELVVVLGEHHNLGYQGQHVTYVQLVQVGDYLLKGIGVGDAASGESPTEAIEALGFSAQELDAIMTELLASRMDLNSLAEQLAA